MKGKEQGRNREGGGGGQALCNNALYTKAKNVLLKNKLLW